MPPASGTTPDELPLPAPELEPEPVLEPEPLDPEPLDPEPLDPEPPDPEPLLDPVECPVADPLPQAATAPAAQKPNHSEVRSSVGGIGFSLARETSVSRRHPGVARRATTGRNVVRRSDRSTGSDRPPLGARAPSSLADRGFQGFWQDRKARRRGMLEHSGEEQRSEAAESRRKPHDVSRLSMHDPQPM
jgi:hypothetical protein